jgi:hypothetical protein
MRTVKVVDGFKLDDFLCEVQCEELINEDLMLALEEVELDVE